MGYFSLRPWLTTLIGVVAVVAVLTPFVFGNPIPYFGMPGALAVGVAIAVAIAAGPLPGVIVAAVGGAYFIVFVADPSHHFYGAATYATVVIWMVVALVAGLVADRLRARLDDLFREVETRDERIRGTLEAATAAVGLFAGPDLRCRNANERLRALFVDREWADRPLAQLIPGLPPSLAGELRACVVGDRAAMQVDEVFLPTVKRTFSLSVRCGMEATEPTLFVTMIDVTSSLQVRRALERLLALTQELHVGQTPRQVADAACRIATEMFGCETASFWNIQGDDIDIVARIPGPPPVGEWKLEQIGDLRRLVDTREPVFIHDVQEHYSEGPHGRLQAYFRKEGYHSLLGLPISYGDVVGALLVLAWHEHVDHPTDELLIVARRFADEAAIAVERARSLQQQQQRLAAEEETARLLKRLEQSLLPRPELSTSELRVEYHYVAGEEKMRIGGDFLGAVETSSGELALVIGDVSGHGPDAAALGATLRASWRARVLAGVEPAEMMARLEQVLERDRPDDAEFVTVCCAWLDPHGSHLRVVLGGHHRPLLLDGEAREIEVPYGPALGMFPKERWQAADVELPGDWALLFYTDGLVEGRAAAGSRERLGLRRLVGMLEKNGSADSIDHASLVQLVDEVRRANGAPLADDVAVLFVAPRVPALARR
ncbi:MAG: PP2C family protein-serine/threonine phosphatase [Thermoleophilia bacterium]